VPLPCYYIRVHSPDPLRLVLLNRVDRWDIDKSVFEYNNGDVAQLVRADPSYG
jgi:hypothetical protein